MSAQNPFDHLLEQFKHLLKYVEENVGVESDQLKIPADINEQLLMLQRQIDQYNRLGDDIIGFSGVSQEEIKMRIQGVSKDISPEGKELMNKTHLIRNETENIKKKIEAKLKAVDQKSSQTEEAPAVHEEKERNLTDEEKTKKRKSKFKRFGSDKNWKPL